MNCLPDTSCPSPRLNPYFWPNKASSLSIPTGGTRCSYHMAARRGAQTRAPWPGTGSSSCDTSEINDHAAWVQPCHLNFKFPFMKLLFYRVVQLNFTPEMEVFYMLLERSLSTFSMLSLKQLMEYFYLRCKIQLDLQEEKLWKIVRYEN